MQVRSLLSLFVDIERTDRSNAFYEKFNTRYKAGQILGAPYCHLHFCRSKQVSTGSCTPRMSRRMMLACGAHSRACASPRAQCACSDTCGPRGDVGN